MARRRATGSIYRRRLPGRGPDGRPRYAKGWYIRLRRHGRDVRRYGGPDRQTAREVLRRMEREIDREHLLGEHPEQIAADNSELVVPFPVGRKWFRLRARIDGGSPAVTVWAQGFLIRRQR